MTDLILSEDLTQIGISVTQKEEVIWILADKLKSLGCVKTGFYESVITRERDYPTGLPSAIPVALCHTESQFVNQSALAVGTLTSPVMFNEMGSPDREIPVQIVFLIALKHPPAQSQYLKSLVSLLHDENLLREILNATKSQTVLTLLKANLRL